MSIVLKSGNLNFLKPSGPVQVCNRIALPFYGLLFKVINVLTLYKTFLFFFSVIFQLKRGNLKNKPCLTNFNQLKSICTYRKGLCMSSRTKHLNKGAHTKSDMNSSLQSVRSLLLLHVVWNPLPPSLVYSFRIRKCVLPIWSEHNYIFTQNSTLGTQLHVSALYIGHRQVVL